jgi:hypothetical protein
MAQYSVEKKQTYNLEDLTILAADNDFIEFFDHAKDLPPRKRDKIWKTMVEVEAMSYLRQLRSQPEITFRDLALIKKISNWPIFIKNELFISKRDEIFLKAMELCKEDCKKQASHLFKNFPHGPNFNYHYLKVATKLGQSHETKWNIIESFVQGKFSEFYCHRPDLKSIVINQIYIDVNTHGELKKLIHPDCLKRLIPTLRKNLTEKSYKNKKGSFLALRAMKKLDPLGKNLYLIEQFLQNEDLNHTEINQSLASLNTISLDYTLRELVLNKLKRHDPLPGRLFKNVSKPGLGRIRILARKFPEMIDLYAKTCLSYLNGVGDFPNGNPTPECHELFKLSKGLNILPNAFLIDYHQATKFLNKSL